MIYTFPNVDEPIRQGDVFGDLPRVDVSVGEFTLLEGDCAVRADWAEVAETGEIVSAVFPVRPVKAIVATQDCDNIHGTDITLCEIRDFRDVYKQSKDTSKVKSWVNILTQHARLNLKWFYLPPDDRVGLRDKSAVDFTITIRMQRVDLEGMRHLRKGRLNDVADEHFRERIAEFFRRYPYDEWYPLNADELAEYQDRHPEAKPFPWQRPNSGGPP